MKKTLLLPTILALLLSAGACRKYDGAKAAAQRDAWVESLRDSISAIAAARQADSLRLEELRTRLTDDIADFTEVSNPREVEPYYILKAYRGRYPLSSTGIAARMTKGEQLELIAALSGARFNAIRVSADGRTASTLTVPADQALNYTSGGLTTVAFAGAQADSVGMVVADAGSAPVRLEYLQNGAVAKAVTLTPEQQAWVGKTSAICASHREALRLEKELLLASRKIEILNLTLRQQSAPDGSERAGRQ